MSESKRKLTIGVLALQGAFEEHEHILRSLGCDTIQVKMPAQLNQIDGIIFPGGESTAMGLIGTHNGIWTELQHTVLKRKLPTWGTCAGMVLLTERCVGTSAVIENGQSLIGGLDVLVCRNYFGSQVSSFELPTPAPPLPGCVSGDDRGESYPGVFIRAPAILLAGSGVEVLGKVIAKPCRQAAATLQDLDKKIALGETVITMSVVDALHRETGVPRTAESTDTVSDANVPSKGLSLPGAAEGSDAREVICVVKKDNILCTAFHPELTNDRRWHEYFLNMVRQSLDEGK